MSSLFDKFVGSIEMDEAVDNVVAISFVDRRLVVDQLEQAAALLEDIVGKQEFDSCLTAMKVAIRPFLCAVEELSNFPHPKNHSTSEIDRAFSALFEHAHSLAWEHLYDIEEDEVTTVTEQRCEIIALMSQIMIDSFRHSSDAYVNHEGMYAELSHVLLYVRNVRDQRRPNFALPAPASEQEQREHRVWMSVDRTVKLLTPVLLGHPLMVREFERQERERTPSLLGLRHLQ